MTLVILWHWLLWHGVQIWCNRFQSSARIINANKNWWGWQFHDKFKSWNFSNTVQLLLFNGSDVVFSGVCTDQITVEFPHYPLKGEVQDDVINIYKLHGGDRSVFPKLPEFVVMMIYGSGIRVCLHNKDRLYCSFVLAVVSRLSNPRSLRSYVWNLWLFHDNPYCSLIYICQSPISFIDLA